MCRLKQKKGRWRCTSTPLMIDALQFLEEHRNWRFPYFKDTPLRQRIAWRRLGFSAWRAGAISFRDAMQNLLSSAGKSQSLMKRMWAFANAHFMDDIRAQNLHQEGIAVFGRPFNLASEREETLKWIATFKPLPQTNTRQKSIFARIQPWWMQERTSGHFQCSRDTYAPKAPFTHLNRCPQPVPCSGKTARHIGIFMYTSKLSEKQKRNQAFS